MDKTMMHANSIVHHLLIMELWPLYLEKMLFTIGTLVSGAISWKCFGDFIETWYEYIYG